MDLLFLRFDNQYSNFFKLIAINYQKNQLFITKFYSQEMIERVREI